jgi:putative sigma-54 modulation protein
MADKIEIYAKNLEVTDHIKDYVTKKLSKFERFLSDIDETRVDLSFIKSARSAGDRHVAQVTMRGRGYVLRTEERAVDIFAAIDLAVDKMQRQIERLKGRRARGRGDGTPASEVSGEKAPAVEEEGQPVVARRKSFTLHPMDEIEAIEQMKLLGHEDFFIFYNANTNAINVLYLRRDGTYGLIEPKVG